MPSHPAARVERRVRAVVVTTVIPKQRRLCNARLAAVANSRAVGRRRGECQVFPDILRCNEKFTSPRRKTTYRLIQIKMRAEGRRSLGEASTATSAEVIMAQSTDFFVEPYRQTLQSTVELLALALGSASRFHEEQLKAIGEIGTASGDALKQIQGAGSFPELIELQQTLLRGYMEKSITCWSGLCEAAGRSNLEALKRVQDRLAQAGDELRKIASGAPGEAAPAMAAFQSMIDAARQAYAVTAKTAEDFTRVATSQVENASSAARAQSGKAAHSRPAA
jgi:hypothetical protein